MKNDILFSNTDLQMTYGNSCYHNPVFLNGDAWFWVVNLDFAVWAYRAISTAKLNNALTPERISKWDAFRKVLRDVFGSKCDEIPAMAKQPIKLPPIPPEWFSLTFCAHMGLTSNPPWPTFNADRARFCTEPADRTEPAEVAPTATVVNVAKTETETKTLTMTFDQTSEPQHQPQPSAA